MTELSPFQADILINTRRLIAEWKEHLAMFEDGRMRITNSGVDVTPEWKVQLGAQIARNEDLLAKYDPDGLTV